MAITSPILVVGGGPSGLAAALLLAQSGIPVRIVDKARAFHTMSRGAGIHPRTTELFRFLGVAGDISRYSKDMPTLQAYKLPGGTEVVKRWQIVEKIEPTPDRPEPSLLVSQYHTEGVFREHLAKFNIHVELGTEPVSVKQDADGVAVTLKKTSDDGTEATEEVWAAYVVGADGARGITRKLIGATFEGETKDSDGHVWADVEIEGLTDDYWHVWPRPGNVSIMARPKFEPGSFHVGIIGQNFDPVDLVDEQKFVNFFHETTGRKDLVFKNVKALTYWKPKMRMADKFCEGRIFIAGDAAHVHPPTGGQGLNTSVQDSINLAWKLALVHKGFASSTLLESYQNERLPVVQQMLATTTQLYANLENNIAQRLKATATESSTAPPQSKTSMWNNNALFQLDVNYRWSNIVYDTRFPHRADEESELKAHGYAGYPGGDVRAGDRAPDASGLIGANGVETTLFNLFKPTLHTILAFAPGADDAAKVAEDVNQVTQKYPSNTIQLVVLCRDGVPQGVQSIGCHDKEGHALRGYQAQEGKLSLVVVRPDGYVGAFVDDVDGIQAYFSKIFQGN